MRNSINIFDGKSKVNEHRFASYDEHQDEPKATVHISETISILVVIFLHYHLRICYCFSGYLKIEAVHSSHSAM